MNSHGRSRRRAAFTIPELVVAVMFVAVMASIAIPLYFGRSEITLENASVLLARDLRTAQNNAAYTGLPTEVRFSEDGKGYQVIDSLGRVVVNPRTERPFVRDYSSDAVFRGVHVRLVDFGDDRTLGFDSRGFALEGGRIILTFGDDTREVVVECDTGDLTMIGSTSNWVDNGF